MFPVIGLVFISIIILFFLFVWVIPVRLLIAAWSSGAWVGPGELIGMRLRRVTPSKVVNPRIAAVKAGLTVATNTDLDEVIRNGNGRIEDVAAAVTQNDIPDFILYEVAGTCVGKDFVSIMDRENLKETITVDRPVEWFVGRINRPGCEVKLRAGNLDAGPHQNTVGNRFILRVRYTRFAFDLVEKVLEIDAGALESVRVDVCEIVGDDVELLVERPHP